MNLAFDRAYDKDEHGVFRFRIRQNPSLDAHDGVDGSRIRDMANVRYSLPYWESHFYYDKIDKVISGIDPRVPILDAGCGDGRFTIHLLNHGFENIVALDANYASLLALRNELYERGDLDRVTLVESSVSDLPFRPGSFGLILCIGVLYYLNEEYESGLEEIVRCMRSGGILIETEPDKTGNAVKALLFDGLERFLAVTFNDRFLEYFGSDPLEVRCFDDSELLAIFKKTGLVIINSSPISLFPSLVRLGMKRNASAISEELIAKNEEGVRRAFEYYDTAATLAKHKLWVLQKR